MTTTELAVVQPHEIEVSPEPATMLAPRMLGGLPYLADFSRLADAICRTEMVPQSLRGRADAVLAVVMAGYEIGVGPMQALQSINLIQGKPSLSAELMRALILQAGHQFIPEANSERATIQYRRREWPADRWSTVTYTIEDARKAGLVEWYERWSKTESGKNFKQTWNPHSTDPKPDWVDSKGEHKKGDNYWSRPRSMLAARATSEAARLDFPDVISGISYTPDEIEEFAPVPAGLSQPGEVAVVVETPPAEPQRPSVDPDADEQMKQLAELVKKVTPDASQRQLIAHLREKFGPSGDMKPADIPAAIAIAAGWPDTAPASPDLFQGEQPF